MYSQKHNYIPYSTFTITTVQLHVSAINVGHLQVVHETPYDKLYLHVSGGTVCGVPPLSVDIAYRKVLHVQPEDGQYWWPKHVVLP